MKAKVLDMNKRWSLHKLEVYDKSLELVGAIQSEDESLIEAKAIDNIMMSLAILDKATNGRIDVQQVLQRYKDLKLGEIKQPRGWIYQQVSLNV